MVKMKRRVARPAAGVSTSAEEQLPASAPPPPPESRRRTRYDQAKRHACDTCGKCFTSRKSLSQHLFLHTGDNSELPFSCGFCDKRFGSKFKLVRHDLIHSEVKAFACNVCGKTFNRKDHYNSHVQVHNPVKKHYTCEKPDCRKSYTSLLYYRKHAALHSIEEGNLQCKLCDKIFTNSQDAVYHLKIHTGSQTVTYETGKKLNE